MPYIKEENGYVIDCVEEEYEGFQWVDAPFPPSIMNRCWQYIDGTFVLDEEMYITMYPPQEPVAPEPEPGQLEQGLIDFMQGLYDAARGI